MKVRVIGAGEAFDPSKTNSSFIVEHNDRRLLIDCGFTVPFKLWSLGLGNNIDAVYITHFHGDHALGIPALLVRMVEDIRTSTIHFIGQKGIKEYVMNALEIAYKGFFPKIGFRMDFTEINGTMDFMGFKLDFAPTAHSVPNFSIYISDNNTSVSISGDGAPTPELLKMYREKRPSVIVQECYSEYKNSPIHTSLEDIISFGKELGYEPTFVLTHISRNEKSKIEKAIHGNFKLAEEGQYIV